jgi:transcriptional regulator with XRE-family HTH domain
MTSITWEVSTSLPRRCYRRSVPDRRAGALLRDWRERRHLSQLDLALDAGVSPRHLSFVETGRSRASAKLLLALSDRLEVPLRDRNALLLAAGDAPAFAERSLDAAELAPVRDALRRILTAHERFPAAVVDRRWNLVDANRGLGLLVAGVDPAMLAPPVNVVRLSLHPDGVAPHIVNLGEWRAHLLERLRRQVEITGDPDVRALLREARAYPAPEAEGHAPGQEVAVPLRLRSGGGELRFLSTIATFGTAVDITVAELAIESFFPADEATVEAVHRHAAAGS